MANKCENTNSQEVIRSRGRGEDRPTPMAYVGMELGYELRILKTTGRK